MILEAVPKLTHGCKVEKNNQDVVDGHMVMVDSTPFQLVCVGSHGDSRKAGGSFVGSENDTMGVKSLGKELEGKNYPTNLRTSQRQRTVPCASPDNATAW